MILFVTLLESKFDWKVFKVKWNCAFPEYLSWSILNLLTHCEYSEIKYYWNDLTCNRTVFWFLRHGGTLCKRILVIFTIFLRRKIASPNWNWVRNWLRVISKLETNENWNKSGLDNSSDDINLKKYTTLSNEWNESIDL